MSCRQRAGDRSSEHPGPAKLQEINVSNIKPLQICNSQYYEHLEPRIFAGNNCLGFLSPVSLQPITIPNIIQTSSSGFRIFTFNCL